MRIAKTNESIWSYSGRDNFLVIPINSFVRKDGGLAMSSDLAKEAGEKFPSLGLRWGYLVKNGVVMPIHRSSDFCLVGLKEKDHYASKVNPVVISDSLSLLNETSLNNPEHIYYLQGYLGGEEFSRMHEAILSSDRIVLLLPVDSEESHETVIE